MNRTRRQKLKRILIASVIAVVVFAFTCLLLYEAVELNTRVEVISLYDEQGEPAYELERTYLWGRLLKMELKRVHGHDMIGCNYTTSVLEPAPRESLGTTSFSGRHVKERSYQAQLELDGAINCVIEMQYAETEKAWVERYTGTLADGTLLFELELDYDEPEDGGDYAYHKTYLVHYVTGTE